MSSQVRKRRCTQGGTVTSSRDGRHRRPAARDPARPALAFARPLVDRPRLEDVLASRFERRLTVVVAGPGFGKSSLLAQARQRNAASPRGIDLWFSCRPAHDAASQLGPELAALAGVGPA